MQDFLIFQSQQRVPSVAPPQEGPIRQAGVCEAGPGNAEAQAGLAASVGSCEGSLQATNTEGVWLVSDPSHYEDTVQVRLAEGTLVEVQGTGGSESFNQTDAGYQWWQVQVVEGGAVGWIMAACLQASVAEGGTCEDAQYDAFISGSQPVPLRSQPEIDPCHPEGNVLAELTGANTLAVQGRVGDWLHVIADVNGVATEGYVFEGATLSQGELDSIAVQSVGGHLTDGPYGWDYAYDIWAVNHVVHVRLRISVTAGAGVTAAQVAAKVVEWEAAEAKWTDCFQLVNIGDELDRYGVNVDVQLVAAADADQNVTVQPGPARSNMGTRDTADDTDAASHEIGHMLGQVDEYPDAASPGRATTDATSVMRTNSGEVQEQHYQEFADWLSSRTGTLYTVEPGSCGL